MNNGSKLYFTSEEFIRSNRRMNTIRYYPDSQELGGICKNTVVGETLTPREEGGYNLGSKEFYEVLDGKRRHLGTCYMENLKLARRRNNPNDRLIIAEFIRENDGEEINHCFILNGRNLIDHSNYRKKNLDFDTYNSANVLQRYAEIDYRDPNTCEFTIKFSAQMLKLGRIGKKVLKFKKGDWDVAASKVL